MIPNVYGKKRSHERYRKRSKNVGAYAVPSREMGRIVGIFLREDGQRTQEDERGTDTDRGDLMPLKTCSLGVGLRGGLEGQNTLMKTGSMVKTRVMQSVFTIREATDG